VHLHPCWWKPVVGGLEDWVDQDLGTGLTQHVGELEQPSGVCRAPESVIVLLLEDSAREKQLVRKHAWAYLVVRNGLGERRARIISLRPL
jgi:hypothetical protein